MCRHLNEVAGQMTINSLQQPLKACVVLSKIEGVEKTDIGQYRLLNSHIFAKLVVD